MTSSIMGGGGSCPSEQRQERKRRTLGAAFQAHGENVVVLCGEARESWNRFQDQKDTCSLLMRHTGKHN